MFNSIEEVLEKLNTQGYLGDAKNNWRSDERLAFKEMAGRARKVFWFNPRPRETWDTRDSIMKVYSPFCSRVLECRNLEQLTKATLQVVKGMN